MPLNSTASSRRGSYFARSGKVCKALFGFYAEVRSGGEFFRIIRSCKCNALPSSRRRSAFNVPTNGKIHITTALCEGKAHGQLYLRISSTNESATSDIFIKIRNRLIFRQPFNCRVPDIRNPLRGLFQIYPSSEVLQTDVS